MSAAECYENGREHLHDELQKLDALIHLQLAKHNARYSNGQSPGVSGLFITGEEINKIMEQESAPGESSFSAARGLVLELREKISLMVENSLEKQVYLPFVHLALRFGLSLLELDIILVCLAPELDLKYEKLYAYLHDDVTRKQPSVNLILDLLCGGSEEREAGRTCLRENAPLLTLGLVSFCDEAYGETNPRKSFLSRCMKLDDRICDFLLGHDGLDPRLSSFAKIIWPKKECAALIMEGGLGERLVQLAENRLNENDPKTRGIIFYLKGPYGAGKKSAAEVLCRHLQIPLLLVDTRELALKSQTSDSDPGKLVTYLFREILLQPAAIYFDGFDLFFAPRGGASHEDTDRTGIRQKQIIDAVKKFSFITFFAGQDEWHPPRGLEGRTFITIDFPVPSFPLRKRIWDETINGRFALAPGIDIDGIAARFSFTAGQIRDAVEEAANRAAMRDSGEQDNGIITREDLYSGCRCQSNQKLSEMAQKIKPGYTWTDIILPADKLQQLKEICSHVKYRHIVYSQWGFGEKFSLGNGLNILFSGPSGTGKTMSAEIIAGSLGLELYKIDLSSVVSKYIGETEKNLNRIFKEAETANCILFFDEADALFGKRSEVKDSHDRYANIEIGYLLQKMEEHEGIVILATNFLKNIDEAFKRRIHFSVDFPFPDDIYRLKIWRHIFPAQMPRGEDIDHEFLARKFKFSGGNIKNVAVNAAFLAAEQSQHVGMRHALLGARRELQKMGKHCSPSDFGKYYPLIEQN